jgi:tetratricopeptide (TPR) repeat protein
MFPEAHMLAPSLPLSAYRADRAQYPERAHLTRSDDDLVKISVLLNRCLQVRRRDAADEKLIELRRRCYALALKILVQEDRSLEGFDVAGASASEAVRVLREVADAAEDGGALRLADALMLLAYREFGVEAGVLELGRVLAQRARIARKLGDHEAAEALYGEVRTWGGGLPEMQARADIGHAMLARERGNIPAMRAHFISALENARACGSNELIAKAHHGMMLAAAAAKRFDEALLHAWAAFRDVRGDTARESEALLNVAQAAFDLGHPDVALHTFALALARALPKRLELPALGGAALAAASIGDGDTLRRIVRRTDQVVGGDDFKYDAVAALAEVAKAFALIGDPDAEVRRQAALQAAMRAGFHEIAFGMELERPKTAERRSTALAPESVRQVLEDADSLGNWEELMANI